MLCGPTPRCVNVLSWRPKAIKILQGLDFNGNVFVPERTDNKYDFLEQVEWEYDAITNCLVLVFWVPRDIQNLPGFTTNVEFGRYVKSAFYGRPDGAPHTGYLDWFYQKQTSRKPHNNLEDLLKEAVRSKLKINASYH